MSRTPDPLLAGLLKLASKSPRMRGSTLISRACRQTGLSRVEVQEGLRRLWDSGDISGTLSDLGIPLGDIHLTEQALPRMSASVQQWRHVLDDMPDNDVEALAPAHAALAGWTPKDMQRLKEGLLRLRAEQAQVAHLPRFMVSAQYLMGSSKMLDSLPTRALQNFGLQTMFDSPAMPLMLAGSAHPETVILVENPQALQYASHVTADRPIVWVATYGYGLSMSGNVAGDRLARSVASQHVRAMVAGGNPPPVERVMSHPHMTFWGDLDPEGIRIYERLRTHRPQLRLSALYEPMIEWMQSSGGHPLARATGKDGQQGEYHHPFSSRFCSERGIDQEALCGDPALIRQYASSSLDYKKVM